jgi:hypothetical protein
MSSSPLVSVMVWPSRLRAKAIVSFCDAWAISWRSELFFAAVQGVGDGQGAGQVAPLQRLQPGA